MTIYTNVTFQINDEHLTRFINGIAAHFGYQDTIDGAVNPETKAQYGKRKLRQQMIQWVKNQEQATAIEAIVTNEIDINE